MTDRKNNTSSGTPYDAVFRTMLNDCTSLIIPLVNEVFHEHYVGNEKIEFDPNEHFLNRQDGNLQERITDTSFVIYGDNPKSYHLECQTNNDNSMLVRMFEYDTQIALDQGEIKNNILEVKFPNSAIMFLRSNASTPDKMQIKICVGEESLYQDISVMKVKDYSLKNIFDKKLLFLIPFYIFTHESKFAEYNKDKEKLEILKEEYGQIKKQLEELCNNKEITEYTRITIEEMSNSVLENLARKYENVKKGVKDVMVGQVLDYEAKRIRNEGIEQGIEQGIEKGREELVQNMLLENTKISFIVKVAKMPEEKVQNIKDKLIREGKLKEPEKAKKAPNKGIKR